MRNVQQWRREIDNSVIRVFTFAGVTKTLEQFLSVLPGRVQVINRRGFPGVMIHLYPDANKSLYNGKKIHKGNIIAVRAMAGKPWDIVGVFNDQDAFFSMANQTSYVFDGMERSRNMMLSELRDPHGVRAAYEAWLKPVEVKVQPKPSPVKVEAIVEVDGKDAKPEVEPLVENIIAGSGPDNRTIAKAPDLAESYEKDFGTKEDREPVRTGCSNPYQYRKDPVPEPKPKKKTFAQKLLGFLPLFRR